MYLLTFATLLIAIVGIYAQVIGVQTARMAAQQTGVAPALLLWQSAAVSMAHDVIQYGSYTGPCSLTYSYSTPISPCVAPVASDIHGTVTDGATPPAPYLIHSQPVSPHPSYNICVGLPSHCISPTSYNGAMDCATCKADYDTVNYQFRSVLYQQGTQYYVVTFIPPAASNPGPGFITGYPSGVQLSMSIADVMRQLRNTASVNYNYGYITYNGTTTTVNAGGTCNGVPCVYTLPTAFNTLGLNGGIAVIGIP